MKEISGIALINGKKEIISFNNFDGLKRKLGFKYADIFYFEINHTRYLAVCDDEGLLKENNHTSLLEYELNINESCYTLRRGLKGNIFICKEDYHNEDFESLTDDDYKVLSEYIIDYNNDGNLMLVFALD